MAADADLALVRGFKAAPASDDPDLEAVRGFAKPSTATAATFRKHEAPPGFEELFGGAEAARLGQKTEGGPDVAQRESFARGALQGASLGFGDEASALIDYGVSKVPGLRNLAQKAHDEKFPALTNPDVTYSERRDAYRQRNAEAEKANPKTYLGGELVGGAATIPAAGGFGGAKTLGTVLKTGAKLGAKLGGVSALGSSKADLTKLVDENAAPGEGLRELGNAATDVAKGAALGAALSVPLGVAGHVAGKVLGGARESIRKFVMKDIVGETRGASTKTAKLNLARDAEDVADVVTADPELETALRKASGHNDINRIADAQEVVDGKLDLVTQPRSDLYAAADKALPEGGVRSGDYVKHLEDAAKKLEATGKGQDRSIAKHLRDRVDVIRTSESWGGGVPVFNPEAEIGGEKAGALVSVLEKSKARSRNPAALDQEIANIKAQASQPGYDPDKIVPLSKVRENVTDLQNAAYDAEGGLNGTPRYNRAREVAGYAEDFLDDVKKQAAKKVPFAIKAIDEHDRQVSALLRIKKVLEQRRNHAEQESLGATGEGLFGRAIHAAAHPKATLTREAVATGARGAIAARRAIDRGARSLTQSDSQYARLVVQGLRNGLPLAAAVEAAEAAGRGAAE